LAKGQEINELPVRGGVMRLAGAEVIERLQQAGFALGVGADQDQRAAWQAGFEPGIQAEVG
jgi:hypothetical protein